MTDTRMFLLVQSSFLIARMQTAATVLWPAQVTV